MNHLHHVRKVLIVDLTRSSEHGMVAVVRLADRCCGQLVSGDAVAARSPWSAAMVSVVIGVVGTMSGGSVRRHAGIQRARYGGKGKLRRLDDRASPGATPSAGRCRMRINWQDVNWEADPDRTPDGRCGDRQSACLGRGWSAFAHVERRSRCLESMRRTAEIQDGLDDRWSRASAERSDELTVVHRSDE